MSYAELRSNPIHTPTTLAEFGSVISKNPEAVLWAGGTYLMSRPNFYPTDEMVDIIDLSKMSELQRITRTDRFVDIGSMINAAQLADTGRLILPPLLLKALLSIGSTVLRRQITIGGCLCIPDYRLAIPTALSVLDTMAEMRLYLKSGRSSTKWVPISRLYDKEGKLVNQEGRFILTHIRVGLEYSNYQKFLIAGEPMHKPAETVIIAFQAERNTSSLGKVQMTITFPNMAFFINKEVIGQLTGISLPIMPLQIRQVTGTLKSELQKAYPNIGPLQLARALRMFESILYDINTLYLQS